MAPQCNRDHNDAHTHAKELLLDAEIDAVYIPLPTGIRKEVSGVSGQASKPIIRVPTVGVYAVGAQGG